MKNKTRPTGIISTQQPLRLRWIRSGRDITFPLPSGMTGTWSAIDCGDTALILPRTHDGKIVLINLFRFPVNDFCYELPGGTMEEGESWGKATRREFLEETGYEIVGQLVFLSECWLYNGKTNAKAKIFFADGCHKVKESDLDPVEQVTQLTREELSVEEIHEMIRAGNIAIDPPVALALMAAQLRGLI